MVIVPFWRLVIVRWLKSSMPLDINLYCSKIRYPDLGPMRSIDRLLKFWSRFKIIAKIGEVKDEEEEEEEEEGER